MKTALLVGGTAATGRAIARELTSSGYEVSLYHRGLHDSPGLEELEHIHGDPHFADAMTHDLAGRSWDVTVATYGRIRHLAAELKGRTGHFVAISGMPVIRQAHGIPLHEDDPYEDSANTPPGLTKILPRVMETEQAVLAGHRGGHYSATVVRYPYVYGPYSVIPLEWHVLRRVLDRRPRWIVQGAGLAIQGRCAAPNAARLVGLALQNPQVSGGEVYHAADSRQFTLRDWVAMVAKAAGHEFEFVDIPTQFLPLGVSAVPMAGEFSWVSPRDVQNGLLRHQLVSPGKAQCQLGYQDVVTPEEWTARTVEYWLEHPPEVDGAAGRLGPEEFDYAAEDRVLSWWDSVRTSAPQAPGVRLLRGHPYEHPKVAMSRETPNTHGAAVSPADLP